MNTRLILINADRCSISWKTKLELTKQIEGNTTIWSKDKFGKVARFELWLNVLHFTH